MSSAPAVSVIVPLFNEEENVSILLSELRAALHGIDHELIFVDDGSSDRTVERVGSAPDVRLVRIEHTCQGLNKPRVGQLPAGRSKRI